MSEQKIVTDKESFIVSIPDDLQKDPVVITSFDDKLSSYETAILSSVIQKYPNMQMYSALPNDNASNETLTLEVIDELANGIQSDISKVQKANSLVRRYIITDDIIGKTYESIESNVNTDFKLSYGDYSSQRNKTKKLDNAKATVDIFNKQIGIKHIIREAIPLTFAEGNCIFCLRNSGDGYVVDRYPLGIAVISDYSINGRPVVCINITELESRLKKTYAKDKKNKAIFFENIEKEIKENYPEEVYKAYKAKETQVRLDPKYTGVIRIGNIGRKYGVSPIVRALKSALILENYENSDFTNTKAKAKKIIHQIIRKDAMGEKLLKSGFEYTLKAHDDLMQAWKNKTVVYTSIPQVEKIEYVEPKVDDTNADKINVYRSKIMTTLGIGFADPYNANFSISKISLDQLMRTINSISEQAETVFEDWYRVLFENEGIELEYLPTIKIIDSEVMDMEMKKSLVELLYSKLNCSTETAFSILGFSIEDEKQKRIKENNENYDEEIFKPHGSQYTNTGNNDAGRPKSSNNTDKQTRDAIEEEGK